MVRKPPVTQTDIAKQLRVSRITVSKALRDHPDISAEMKEKVKKTALRMGYSPNLVAANLSQRKTNTIGVVIPDLENSFFAFLTDSIIDTLSERNYRVILTVSRENRETEEQNIRNLTGMRVDGLLVCLSQQTSKTEIFDYVKKIGIPLVFFDRVIKNRGFSSVTFDDTSGTRLALKLLIQKGFTSIAHISGYKNTSIGKERKTAFLSAMKEHRLPVRKEWIIEGGFETGDGLKAFNKIAASGTLPQLILAVNDRVALGVYKAAKEAGLKIPGDISIAGFGFSETAAMFNPPLAVINQDPRLMGKTAAGLIIDQVEGLSGKPKEIQIVEQFVFNDSVKGNN